MLNPNLTYSSMALLLKLSFSKPSEYLVCKFNNSLLVSNIKKNSDAFNLFLVNPTMLWGTIVQWLERRALNQKNPGSNPLAAVLKLWYFVHPTLPQFTQLYECVPGYRQRWISQQIAFV